MSGTFLHITVQPLQLFYQPPSIRPAGSGQRVRGQAGAEGTAPSAPACSRRRGPGAYLRGSRAWALGSTCCQTGRCPPAPWQAPVAAAAGRGEPARRGSCRDPGARPRHRGATAHGHGDTGSAALAGPTASRLPVRSAALPAPIPPMGAGRASYAASHWREPARPSQSRPRPPQDGGAAQSGPALPPCWRSWLLARPGWTTPRGCAGPSAPGGTGAGAGVPARRGTGAAAPGSALPQSLAWPGRHWGGPGRGEGLHCRSPPVRGARGGGAACPHASSRSARRGCGGVGGLAALVFVYGVLSPGRSVPSAMS